MKRSLSDRVILIVLNEALGAVGIVFGIDKLPDIHLAPVQNWELSSLKGPIFI